MLPCQGAGDGCVARKNMLPDGLRRLVTPRRQKASLELPLSIQRCEFIGPRNRGVIPQTFKRYLTYQAFRHRFVEIGLEKGAPVAP